MIILHQSFPRLYAAASLKRRNSHPSVCMTSTFSAALCRGLIEARQTGMPSANTVERFPRLYAAASLKLLRDAQQCREFALFSAALCRGLIEAGTSPIGSRCATAVFRGSMPRPH